MKVVQRLSAWLGLLTGFMVLGATAAVAAPNYPPTTPATEVKGEKISNSGLPHTGFDPSLLWIAAALLVVGALTILATRRRSGKHGG